MLAGVMLTACGNKAEVAETKDTTAASGEESQAASDAAEKETAADTQQTDLEGAEVTSGICHYMKALMKNEQGSGSGSKG